MDIDMDIGALKSFAKSLTAKFALPGAASPEDQLKPLVASLLIETGKCDGLTVESRTETQLSEHKVRPDIAFYVGGLICGYIELKQPGLGADAPKLKGVHNKKQWEKLKGLPNLVYTDGQDWALYREGERQGSIVRLKDDPTSLGERAVDQQNAIDLGALLKNFLGWSPIVPHQPTALAKYLAPMTRFLRSEVETALAIEGSAVALLAAEWRKFFFPEADDTQFADAYAQTVTYAMLLARLSGAVRLDPIEAAKTLDKNNGLLARTLEILGQADARNELRVGFELLQRSLEALKPADFLKSKPDLWLYFYEDFLAAYDPKLRKDYGVYYTPYQVVELQVRLASELLEKQFGKKLGFADDGVLFLDPAVGTGTYPVAAVKHALEKVRARSGEGAVPGRAAQMAANMYGFEILVGPYAVAHLRLTQALEGSGATVKDRLKIYLADTLESPTSKPPHLILQYKVLAQEHEAARRVKNEGDILVCFGNPPYDREQRSESDSTTGRKGGWVRHGDQLQGAARQEELGYRPIFEDFLEPARKAGKGIYLQVIFNDYVYFWRWALWRLFEQQTCGGIVSFITASSYLSGPGFVGMREVMRRTFDELWILDLGGDNLGARKTPNVFAIQIPVAIAMGVRGKEAMPNQPAKVWYAKVEGPTRDAKLKLLEKVSDLSAIEWRACPDDWHAPLLPKGKGTYFDWPKLTEIFPLHTAGAVFYRSWPISETRELLKKRWDKLAQAPLSDRASLFKQSRDRKITYIVNNPLFPGSAQPAINAIKPGSDEPNCIEYGFRSFDRQYAYYDFRLGDYIRPMLYRLASDKQIFLVSPDTLIVGKGQAIIATKNIPDQHHFRGSFGGKDVIPLYRDVDATQPNVTSGLLDCLGKSYGAKPSAEDLAAYVYALLGGQAYTKRFWNELETPGPRIPITKDGDTFSEAAALGRRLIWLHTYAERFRGNGRPDSVSSGTAKNIAAISFDPAKYPEDYEYNEKKYEVRVGDGIIGPVAPEIWEFEISGLKVVQSWLGYRMMKRAGRKSSPLDGIRPERWTPRMTEDFLELLWVLEATLAMEPGLSGVLDKVVGGECFKVSELPTPSAEERKAPAVLGAAGDLVELMEDDTEAGNGDE
jgi:hypothetical protein